MQSMQSLHIRERPEPVPQSGVTEDNVIELCIVWLQAKLLAEVGAMLSGFAEQKAAAVASAVGSMHGLLAQGRSSAEAAFDALAQAASSADGTIKACTQAQLTLCTCLFGKRTSGQPEIPKEIRREQRRAQGKGKQ